MSSPATLPPAELLDYEVDADTLVEEVPGPRVTFLIEPDAPTAAHLAHALKKAGHEVVICADLDDAERAVGVDCPRLIVCELDVDDGRGYALARRLRSLGTQVSIAPLLMLVPPGEQVHSLDGFKLPHDVFLVKPFATDALVARADELAGLAPS